MSKLLAVASSSLLMLLVSAAADCESLTRIAGLEHPATLVRDSSGIPHITAGSERDMVFLQGWVHARDRLFQMDSDRRQAEGTLAELFGSTLLADDVQLRRFGIHRAAERSWPLLSSEVRSALRAYADGVNDYVAHHSLPAEYARLELATFRPWTELDSLSVLSLALFQQSFDLADIERTNVLQRYRTVGAALGFDGNALFFEDINRVAPFDTAATVPDALQESVATLPLLSKRNAPDMQWLDSTALSGAASMLEHLRSLPWARRAMKLDQQPRGSNAFVVAGRHARSGRPLLANDPHLLLTTPAVFYENHLQAPGFDVIGASFPGVPYVVLGHNRRITWGVTTNPLDLTDVYQERVVADAESPSGLSTLYRGTREPVIALPQVFRINAIGDGAVDSLLAVPSGGIVPARILIVPRRNHGAVLSMNPNGTALSVQYAGASGHRTLQALRSLDMARGLQDFNAALEHIDGSAFNFVYADTAGNIAYRAAAEVPIREDLQAGLPNGLPPFFVRNGQGGNEWLAAATMDAERALPFAILASDELPAAVNPPSGVLITANNDPSGSTFDNDPLNAARSTGGILYFGVSFDTGLRAGRIRDLLAKQLDRRQLDSQALQRIQSDSAMNDARFFTPHIVQALCNAVRPDAPALLRELALQPRIREAVTRLAAWDHSAPTGIAEGYDASERFGRRNPSPMEIDNSVAATLYTTWSSQMIQQTLLRTLAARNLPVFSPEAEVFTALQHLLAEFPQQQGIGASGIDFFAVAELAAAEDRRDFVILRSMAAALDLLASPALADAFGGSSQLSDYRWGRVHRLILIHRLGGVFDLPSATGGFPPPLSDLAGIPLDGGSFSVDIAPHALLQRDSSDYMIGGGAARRFVARVRELGLGIEAVTSLPGGASGVLGSVWHANLLPYWLRNEAIPLRYERRDVLRHAAEITLFLPGA